MSKKLIIFIVAITLCVAGVMFLSGCYEKATAIGESKKSSCQAKTTTECSKTVESGCGTKALACPSDCKKDCCAAKQKAGTCPLESSKTSCPKVCPKKTTACSNTG